MKSKKAELSLAVQTGRSQLWLVMAGGLQVHGQHRKVSEDPDTSTHNKESSTI